MKGKISVLICTTIDIDAYTEPNADVFAESIRETMASLGLKDAMVTVTDTITALAYPKVEEKGE